MLNAASRNGKPHARKAGRRRAANGESDHDPIRAVPIGKIRPSPENDALYRPPSSDDQSIKELARSIIQFGVQEPLVLTLDYFVLSGHRRLAAARLAGLETVPCRFATIRRADDLDEFVRLLREHNRQREKTLDEMLREQIVEADPEEAYRRVLVHRARQSEVDVAGEIELEGPRRRARISEAKADFLAAAQKIIADNKQFWPLSVRQVHYRLLSAPPLRHSGKKNSIYRNDQESYKSLIDLLTRARLTDKVPLGAIDDETRVTTTWKVHQSPRAFVAQELDGFLKGYYRNLQQSQPCHVEIVAEKLTVRSILHEVAGRYTIPLTVGKGFASVPPRQKMAARFQNSGRDRLIVLFVTDLDPEGESIAESFARSMRDDLGVTNITPIKVALTHRQVNEFGLPPMMTAKAGSSRRAKFVARHGEHVWELEALPPSELQRLLTEAIDGVIDAAAFNREIDEEKKDAAWLDVLRRRALAAIGELGAGHE